MTLSIRPVRLNKSVYFRVPSDIADLIGLEDDSQVTLTLQESDDSHLLVYSIPKPKHDTQPYSLLPPMKPSQSGLASKTP